MKNAAQKTAFLGLCTALALVLAYVEILIPPIITVIPGIKVGLPNIVIIFLLYRYGFKEAALVSVVRVVAVALLFGNMMGFAYSIAGAAFTGREKKEQLQRPKKSTAKCSILFPIPYSPLTRMPRNV